MEHLVKLDNGNVVPSYNNIDILDCGTLSNNALMYVRIEHYRWVISTETIVMDICIILLRIKLNTWQT